MKKHFLFLAFVACIMFACKPDLEKPTVVTSPISQITETSAVAGGEVTSDGGAEVTSRGVCWSLVSNPTIENEKTVDGVGVGSFQSSLSSLSQNTTYYLRAYATNSEGTSYGEEVSFTTLEIIDDDTDDDTDDNDNSDDDNSDDTEDDEEIVIELAVVTTLSVTDITETSAVVGGEVISDGGAEVTSRGICWSLSSNPTIENNKTVEGEGVGSFQSVLSGLSQNTTYYVRAYATNSEGTAYGEEVSFKTLEEVIIILPTVVTKEVSDITETSAVVGGEVTSDGGAKVTSRGVCWSLTSNPTIENDKTVEGEGVGSFQSSLSDLSQNTTYYVRAYATNSEGTAYGEEFSFKTLEEIIDDGISINGYEYVDLGLPSGLKWATCNIGAAAPNESGDYFAWGEINPKAEFTEANCTSYGLNMNDIAGNPQYDAARAIWGATWKVPSKKDFEELMNECTWEWMVINGRGCKKVTGPNGNHIILPITGYKYGTSSYMDDFGYYWTSTPISTYEQFSYDFFFDQEYNLSMGFDERCYGQAIRPVSE